MKAARLNVLYAAVTKVSCSVLKGAGFNGLDIVVKALYSECSDEATCGARWSRPGAS